MAKIIPVRPKAPPPKAKAPVLNKSPKKDDDKKDSGKGKAPKDPYKAAEARANKKEAAAKKKAGQKYLDQAGNLEAQVKAIRQAIDIDFASARDSNLGDVSMRLNEQFAALKTGHTARAQEFLKSGSDAEKATGATQESAMSNFVRERQDALTGILEQGAGETDTMKAMLMAARNWNANANEANRSYFDSMQSVNSGLVDLNLDTKNSLAGAWTSAEGERDRLWQTYYDQRGEAFTQLGNIKGQQRDYYAQAKEMGVKPKKGTETAAKKASEKAFADAATEAGKGYTQEKLPTWVEGFEGQAKMDASQSNSNLAAAVTMEPVAKAEGATLRKWAA
jgi:hypothetical protein